MITEAQKAYIAGLFDGEGCFSTSYTGNKRYKGMKKCPYFNVRISNTNKECLDLCLSLFPKGHISGPRIIPNRLPIYQFGIYGKNAIEFINEILPYLIIKREKAKERISLS